MSIAAVASGVNGSAVAYTVNGTKVSQSTVDRELEWLAGNRSVAANVEQQGGTLTSSDGSITSAITRQLADPADPGRAAAPGGRPEQGVKVTAADRARRWSSRRLDRYPNAPESASAT